MKKGLTDREKKPAADSPVTGLEDTIIHRAAAEKSRNKALAQHLRKTGQIASLSAEVSSVIEDFSSLSNRIARSLGTGKKALDKVNAETEAAVEFSGPMPESSQDVFQKVLGIMNALEYMSDLFGEHARSFTEILDDTNRAARVHSETQKSADELAKLAETGDSLIGSIENIAELLDVAGLNAALEAERSGEHSAGLSVIARRIQKTAADFEKTAGDFSNLVTDVKTRSGGAVEKIKALGDRIRTISVMTKGVKNAYDDLRADFTEICNRAVGLSDRANDAFPLNGDFSPGSETLLECSRRASALVDKAVLALETRESVFTAALRQSDSISSAASRLASGDNLIAALDDIINATDDFMGIAEETEDEQEAAVSILGDTAREMENMERSTEATGEILTVMARGAVDILDVSNNMNKKLDDIRKTIDNSGTALHGIAKELELLCTENRAFDQELRAFGLSIQQMVFFCDLFPFCL